MNGGRRKTAAFEIHCGNMVSRSKQGLVLRKMQARRTEKENANTNVYSYIELGSRGFRMVTLYNFICKAFFRFHLNPADYVEITS